MNELLTDTLNTTERNVQHSDQGFAFAKDSVGAAPTKHRSALPPRRAQAETLSEANPGGWVLETFPVVDPLASVASGPETDAMFISPLEAQFLDQIRKDLDELKEPVRSSSGAERCRRFAEGVGMALAYAPRTRCAVFGDDEDGVELVAHSRASMRQVSFAFGPEENSIKIISIDEQMHRFERSCRIDHVRTLGEAIAWLNPR